MAWSNNFQSVALYRRLLVVSGFSKCWLTVACNLTHNDEDNTQVKIQVGDKISIFVHNTTHNFKGIRAKVWIELVRAPFVCLTFMYIIRYLGRLWHNMIINISSSYTWDKIHSNLFIVSLYENTCAIRMSILPRINGRWTKTCNLYRVTNGMLFIDVLMLWPLNFNVESAPWKVDVEPS